VVAPGAGVVVTEPRLEPAPPLLTLTETLVVGVDVVAVVVVAPAPPPASGRRVVLVLAPDTSTDPAA
jgi:hypothetical protein